jgi:hypothetical protein
VDEDAHVLQEPLPRCGELSHVLRFGVEGNGLHILDGIPLTNPIDADRLPMHF